MTTALPLTSFFKLSGAGNDFIALVEPHRAPTPVEIKAWCRRGLSLGADGVFTLERRADGARMVHYDADGSRAELCLNGSRCATRLALHLGWADGELRLVTDAGELRARDVGPDRIALELPDIVSEPAQVTFASSGQRYNGWRLAVGVPHLVLPWRESLRRAPVAELGAALRSHPDLSAEGANVDFVRYLSLDRGEIRSFERGVEAETLACGTGVVAAVAVGLATHQLSLPVTLLTAGGYELTVDRFAAGGNRLGLEGDARILAAGEIFGGAAEMPPPPDWNL